MTDLHLPQTGPLDEFGAPVDRFLFDLAAVEWAARDTDRVVSLIEFTATAATVRITRLPDDQPAAGSHAAGSHAGEEGGRRFGPLALDADRAALLERLVHPAGLPDPGPAWQPMPFIPGRTPGGGDNWREFWAQPLVDLAQYAWMLRLGPHGLPGVLRYERVELTGAGDPVTGPVADRVTGPDEPAPPGAPGAQREAVVVVVDADEARRGGPGVRRWVTRIALPSPVDLTAAPLTIAEWISDGDGRPLDDHTLVNRLSP